MFATHYTDSRGHAREIAAMIPEHIANALAKLEREQPHRTDEIAAMRAELVKRPPQAK